MSRWVFISDTHGNLPRELPLGDVLVHCGDLSSRGTVEEINRTATWLRSQPHKHKVVIAGNHDFSLETPVGTACLDGLTYLCDSGTTLYGLRVWGSPWIPPFQQWAFMRSDEERLQAWERIPADTDVLVTHCPPWRILDRTREGLHVGCKLLLDRVTVLRPRLHVFGHIHEDGGRRWKGTEIPTEFINASWVALDAHGAKPPNSPVVVDL